MTDYRRHMLSAVAVSASSRIERVYFALCKAVDTPVSLGLWLRFKYGEHKQLAEKEMNPRDYHDLTAIPTCGAWQFQNDYLVISFLSKYKGLDTGIDTKAVALQKFNLAEERCGETNIRLRNKAVEATRRFAPVLYLAQRKIADILGPCDVAFRDCGWGPGSTFSLSRVKANLVDKLCEKQVSVTPGALKYAQVAVGQDVHWLRARGIPADGECTLLPSEFLLVRGNKVTTVSKNAKTDRVIALEPTANIFLQKAFGAVIRRRLLHVGVDLNDQSKNQRLARRAYTDRLATVDLSAASDTISRQLVFDLLPDRWASLLDQIRSPEYQLENSWHRYRKFSSMGNGFTFELESLIFYGLAWACCNHMGLACESLSVYGDDIILPSEAVPLLLEVFAYTGFVINEQKTFADSCFRESCGKHFFKGQDVTPIYQKEVPDAQAEAYRLANRIRRYAVSSSGVGCSLSIFRSAWLAALRGISQKHLHFLPLSSESDTGIVLSSEDFQSFGIAMHPTGAKVPQLVFQQAKKSVNNDALLAYWLRFWPEEPFQGQLAFAGRGKYAVRKRRIYSRHIDAPWV